MFFHADIAAYRIWYKTQVYKYMRFLIDFGYQGLCLAGGLAFIGNYKALRSAGGLRRIKSPVCNHNHHENNLFSRGDLSASHFMYFSFLSEAPCIFVFSYPEPGTHAEPLYLTVVVLHISLYWYVYYRCLFLRDTVAHLRSISLIV